MKKSLLFLDIETQANPENLVLMPDPKPPANLKDPAKIEIAIAEKKAEQIEMAALDPDYGRILSIGAYISAFNSGTIHINRDIYPGFSPTNDDDAEFDVYATTETEMIEAFWDDFRECRGCCIGYNILGFDLPYLLRRSMALGVKVPLMPVLARYRVEPVTDLMMILYNWGAEKYKGLKQVARLYGIPNHCPDVDGSKVKDLDPETLRAYQESDVRLTIELFNRMNGVYFNL